MLLCLVALAGASTLDFDSEVDASAGIACVWSDEYGGESISRK
ncbi:hypothetical protein [Lentzea atacamensis]|nr:hypothetical protein [Lentzea atacamensis]